MDLKNDFYRTVDVKISRVFNIVGYFDFYGVKFLYVVDYNRKEILSAILEKIR